MGLRCFVAMAIGREDTDKVYDTLIEPTLRKKGITPVRVDRLPSNDPIDDLIRSEIHECDFAIADLTYARPSVYFEAGYAERKVPVIYTCRKDHFEPRTDDDYGNFRVHFDLQMKNIIHWSDPGDHMFAGRLAKRVANIVAPLVRVQAKQEVEIKEAQKFALLSLREKINRIENICVSHISSAGYQIIDRAWVGGWLGWKSVHDRIYSVYVRVAPNLTKKQLAFLGSIIGSTYETWEHIDHHAPVNRPRQLETHFFVCSTQRVPVSRIEESLPDFRLDEQLSAWIHVEERFRMREGRIFPREVFLPLYVYIHVFDAIKSEKAFTDALSKKLERLDSLRVNVEQNVEI